MKKMKRMSRRTKRMTRKNNIKKKRILMMKNRKMVKTKMERRMRS